VRGFIYDQIRRRTTPRMRRLLKTQGWLMPLLSRLFGSEIYSKSYYDQIEQAELGSVEAIAEWISDCLKPSTVIDVGCGPGHLMSALHRRGVRVLGLDYSKASERHVRTKGLPFATFDLTRRETLPGSPWDLLVCCEVAEHLDEQHADAFVDNLTSGSARIFLTAAEPGGNGLNHVNEQPNSYWISRFGERGFSLDQYLTTQARSIFAEKEVVHYLAKPMIFRKSTNGSHAAEDRVP
jgi:cyclopropane fatty-acyl-phospholipid synthase-like methyltransferase